MSHRDERTDVDYVGPIDTDKTPTRSSTQKAHPRRRTSRPIAKHVSDPFTRAVLTPLPKRVPLAVEPKIRLAQATSSTEKLGNAVDTGFDQHQLPQNMKDALKTQLPIIPSVYVPYRVNKTKNTTHSELNIEFEKELNFLVYYPELLDQADAEASNYLSQIHLDWNNVMHVAFVVFCLPIFGMSLCPAIVWTESDVVTWLEHTILRPALATLRSFTIARSRDRQPQPVLENLTTDKYPSLTSAPSTDVNPDRIFIRDKPTINFPDDLLPNPGERGPKDILSTHRLTAEQARRITVDPKDSTFCTVEVKSQNVWTLGGLNSERTLFSSYMKVPPGKDANSHTMRFAWPRVDPTGVKDKETKVLIQVWTQMVKYDARRAILSCQQNTIFFVRPEDRDDVLYMSRTYTPRDCPQYWTFCLLASSILAGILKELVLPPLTTEHWPEDLSDPIKYELDVSYMGVVKDTIAPSEIPDPPNQQFCKAGTASRAGTMKSYGKALDQPDQQQGRRGRR